MTFEFAFVVVYFAILCILSIYGIHRFVMATLYRIYRKDIPHPDAKFSDLPRVTIQLPMFNERYVIERLIDAVCEIRYPREKLQIQVLDDSIDETQKIAADAVARKREQGFDIVYIHRDDRTGFKAGALEAGLKTATGEFVAVFDADFVPQPDFLERTIHFFTNEKVGMVQVRWEHLNREYSLLTRVQSILLDGHFVIEHTARNRSGRFFNFNGTAGIWRKSTIADAGGWQHDTITEDLDLSYRAQSKGWQFIYVNESTTPAEVPVEMVAFKTQQHRWAKGSIQVAKIAQESTPFQSQTRSMDAFDVQYLLYSHGHLVADDAPNRRIPRQKFVDDEYLGRCHRLYMRLGLDHDVLSLGAKRSTQANLHAAFGLSPHRHEPRNRLEHQKLPRRHRSTRRICSHAKIRRHEIGREFQTRQIRLQTQLATVGRNGNGHLFRLGHCPRHLPRCLCLGPIPRSVLHRLSLRRIGHFLRAHWALRP